MFTRRAILSLLPALWRAKSGEVVSEEFVWAKQPAISSSADCQNVFIDLGTFRANLVLSGEKTAYRLTPADLKALFEWLTRKKK